MTWLALGAILLAGAAAAGYRYGRGSGRLDSRLSAAREQRVLLRGSLAAADSAVAFGQARLATLEPGGATAFLQRIESLPLTRPPDTVRMGFVTVAAHYGIQISSHRSREEATQAAARLQAAIRRGVGIEEVEMQSGRWYRVMVEPFPSESRARAWADSLTAQGVIREYIVQDLSRRGG